jgi:hypothetical protein
MWIRILIRIMGGYHSHGQYFSFLAVTTHFPPTVSARALECHKLARAIRLLAKLTVGEWRLEEK